MRLHANIPLGRRSSAAAARRPIDQKPRFPIHYQRTSIVTAVVSSSSQAAVQKNIHGVHELCLVLNVNALTSSALLYSHNTTNKY